MKKRLFNLLKYIFFNVMVTLVLIEIGLRAFPGLIPLTLLIRFEPRLREQIAEAQSLPTVGDTIEVFERDDKGPPLRIWKPFTKINKTFDDPGTVKVVTMDELGFCNLSGSYQQVTLNIITIGDSFTWCFAVNPEDTWTKQLSDLTNLSAYNLGKDREGLHEYLQILKEFGVQKSPKLVIMNIYEGNDLRDAVQYWSYRENPPLSSYPRTIYRQFFKDGPITHYSYSFNLLRATILYTHSQILFPSPQTKMRTETNFRYHLAFSENSIPFNLENTDTDEVIYAKRLFNQEVDLEIFTAALKEFVELSKQYNFVPIVTYTPSAHTTYATVVVFDDPNLGRLMEWFSQEQRNFLKVKGEELGYIFIDFTPSFQSAASEFNNREKLLYFQTNLHLTKHGHQLIAETLYNSWENLVPQQ
jgi:hypothetical protein